MRANLVILNSASDYVGHWFLLLHKLIIHQKKRKKEKRKKKKTTTYTSGLIKI